jgi:CheY-like chemotaxis protein
MPTLITAIILFIVADIAIRVIMKRSHEKKLRREREEALNVSLNLDFTHEAKTLKRAEVESPKARILAVDDEEVILSSFRKILVLDGYSVDTVETGQEALGLIQTNHYDFVFTDLKMPEMDGVEVCKSVKHMRPDIDVIIITGYASVDTAVETMKHGAMDYVQKPFTEEELLAFTKKAYFKRSDRIKRELKPQVKVTQVEGLEQHGVSEFAIPGGVFISEGHSWMALEPDGTVKVGLDDFGTKIIGQVSDISFPNLGMQVKQGQLLFRVKHGDKAIPVNSPVTGKVVKMNKKLAEQIDLFDVLPYNKKWVCQLDAENIHQEITALKIGESAVNFYQDDIEALREFIKQEFGDRIPEKEGPLKDFSFLNFVKELNENDWKKVINKFFNR